MKYTIAFLLSSLCWMACNSNQKQQEALKGNWKTDKVYYGHKDISKRSDPSNENGLWFDGVGQYRRFGNPGHQEEGTYQLQGELLIWQAKGDSLTTSAYYHLEGDSLALVIPLINDDTIKMNLYRMQE